MAVLTGPLTTFVGGTGQQCLADGSTRQCASTTCAHRLPFPCRTCSRRWAASCWRGSGGGGQAGGCAMACGGRPVLTLVQRQQAQQPFHLTTLSPPAPLLVAAAPAGDCG